MSSWLRGRRNEADATAVPPDVVDLLPPSVRRPEAGRFAAPDANVPDDADDADLDFLAALASEIDGKAVPTGDGQPQTPLRGASPRIDDLQVFRQMKDEGDKTIRFDHQVADVEMGDLLEELNTIRAALRGRKAA
jgi:hypothetical protein